MKSNSTSTCEVSCFSPDPSWRRFCHCVWVMMRTVSGTTVRTRLTIVILVLWFCGQSQAVDNCTAFCALSGVQCLQEFVVVNANSMTGLRTVFREWPYASLGCSEACALSAVVYISGTIAEMDGPFFEEDVLARPDFCFPQSIWISNNSNLVRLGPNIFAGVPMSIIEVVDNPVLAQIDTAAFNSTFTLEELTFAGNNRHGRLVLQKDFIQLHGQSLQTLTIEGNGALVFEGSLAPEDTTLNAVEVYDHPEVTLPSGWFHFTDTNTRLDVRDTRIVSSLPSHLVAPVGLIDPITNEPVEERGASLNMPNCSLSTIPANAFFLSPPHRWVGIDLRRNDLAVLASYGMAGARGGSIMGPSLAGGGGSFLAYDFGVIRSIEAFFFGKEDDFSGYALQEIDLSSQNLSFMDPDAFTVDASFWGDNPWGRLELLDLRFNPLTELPFDASALPYMFFNPSKTYSSRATCSAQLQLRTSVSCESMENLLTNQCFRLALERGMGAGYCRNSTLCPGGYVVAYDQQVTCHFAPNISDVYLNDTNANSNTANGNGYGNGYHYVSGGYVNLSTVDGGDVLAIRGSHLWPLRNVEVSIVYSGISFPCPVLVPTNHVDNITAITTTIYCRTSEGIGRDATLNVTISTATDVGATSLALTVSGFSVSPLVALVEGIIRFPAPSLTPRTLSRLCGEASCDDPAAVPGLLSAPPVNYLAEEVVLQGQSLMPHSVWVRFSPSVSVTYGPDSDPSQYVCTVVSVYSSNITCRTSVPGVGQGLRFTLTFGGFVVRGQDEYNYPAAPVVYSVSSSSCVDTGMNTTVDCPTSGFTNVSGTLTQALLTIYGRRFVEPLSVTLRGESCAPIVHDSQYPSQRIMCPLPAATGEDLLLSVSQYSLAGSLRGVSYAKPQVTHISGCSAVQPTATELVDCSRSGERISIFGSDFGASGSRVLVGTGECTGLIPGADPHRSLSCVLPAGVRLAQSIQVLQGGSGLTSSGSVLVSYQQCSAGFFQNGTAVQCGICPEGTFTSSPGLPECVLCNGEVTAGRTACQPCITHAISGPDGCLCKQSFVNVSSSASLQCQCPAGTELSSDSSRCVQCGSSFFQPSDTLSPCRLCPARSSSASLNIRNTCVCQDGYYPVYEVSSSGRLVSQCESCPRGALCSQNRVAALKGFWKDEDVVAEAGVFYECPVSEACSNGTCAEGYTGFICASCAAGFVPTSGGTCIKSDASRTVLWVFIFLVVMAAATTYAYHSSNKRPIVRVVVWNLQIMAQMSFNERSDGLSVLGIAQGDLLSSSAFGGFSIGSTIAGVMLRIFTPLYLIIMLLIHYQYQVMFHRHDASARRRLRRAHSEAAMRAVMFTYFIVANAWLSCFACREVGSRTVLIIDAAIPCRSHDHAMLMLSTTLVGGVFCLGVPMMLMWGWFHARLGLPGPGAWLQLQHLELPYKLSYRHWTFVEICFRLLIVAVVQSMRRHENSRSIVLLICIYMVAAAYTWRPFALRVVNLLGLLMTHVTLLCYVLYVYYSMSTESVDKDRAVTAILSIILLSLCGVAAWLVYTRKTVKRTSISAITGSGKSRPRSKVSGASQHIANDSDVDDVDDDGVSDANGANSVDVQDAAQGQSSSSLELQPSLRFTLSEEDLGRPSSVDNEESESFRVLRNGSATGISGKANGLDVSEVNVTSSVFNSRRTTMQPEEPEQPGEQPHQAREQGVLAGAVADTAEDLEEEPLPNGWRRHSITQDGVGRMFYYHNESTNTTQWEHPEA